MVNPNEIPKEEFIKNSVKEKEKIVGGHLNHVYLEQYPDIVFICNLEGKINGLPYNRYLGSDFVAGSFIIAGDDSEMGEDRSLTSEQIKKYQSIFNEKSIVDTNLKITKKLVKKEFDLI